MDKINLSSPSKINLYLKITGKRPDGYHNIRTIFQSIDLCDEIILEKTGNGIEIICDNPDIPIDQTNIAHKAASLVFQSGGGTYGIKITIKKKVPVLAGLGGGSGNAASVIKGVNSLYELGLSKGKMAEIALKCGADVPFLLSGGTALGEGIGEELKFYKPLKDAFFLLVNPGVRKPSTKEIYENFRMQLTNPRKSDNNIITFLEKDAKTGGDIPGILYNDLESVTEKLIPMVREIREALVMEGALGAMMTGSGPTVFGVFREQRKAAEAEKKLRKRFHWVNIAKASDQALQ